MRYGPEGGHAMKNSIRAQLLTLFVGVMCFTLVVVGLTNYLFLGD